MDGDAPATAGGDWIRPLQEGALLALCPTPLSAGALRSAAAAAAGVPHSVRVPFGAETLTEAFAAALTPLGSGLPESPWAQALIQLLRPALGVLGVSEGTLRIEVVQQCTCPRLHVDRLRWRLGCSVVGPGTEYLPPGVAPRHDGEDRPVAVPTAVLAAMAGALAGPGLWHRSPHACASHPRLFVSVDVP